MLVAALLFVSSWAISTETEEDPFLWLEEIEGTKALEWVKEQNARSLQLLESDPRFDLFVREAERIIQDKRRIPFGTIHRDWVYNFWQDEEHVRGIWRRTKREEYRKADPAWETLIDVDQIARIEGENWVFKGAQLYEPSGDLALITLSRGGSDASVVREFDLRSKSFPSSGFQLPEAKSRVAWFHRDAILVATDFGPGSLTSSGYPRIAKLWTRGTPLPKAVTLLEIPESDVGIEFAVSLDKGQPCRIIDQSMTFYTSTYHLIHEDGTRSTIPVDPSAKLIELAGVDAFFVHRESKANGSELSSTSGRVERWTLDPVDGDDARIKTLISPTSSQTVEGVSAGPDCVNVVLLDDVSGSIRRYTPDLKSHKPIALPANLQVGIVSSDEQGGDLLLSTTGFLEPARLWCVKGADSLTPELLKAMPSQFESAGLIVERHNAISKDGERIPYFVVRRKDLTLDGSAPTLLYAYGGFEIPMLPAYSGTIGKLWLEPGGVYVLACIRGGGEYGPRWHQAALKQNRQRAYDDFQAVAEDMIKQKISSPRRLGIMGGSNGGLLMGTSFTQRPDLFHAVVCQVPLLDMIRYTKLLAGASWIAEYGDPLLAEERTFIERYSPYQNVLKDRQYPEVFFLTSTKDDRVHPGHARKMVAKMIDQGHPVLYFENIEGGHGAAANLKQRAKRTALEFIYLHRKLFDP